MSRINDAIAYLSEVRLETKKVVFPKRRDTVVTTYAVLVFVAVVAVIMAVIDWILSGMTNFMISR
jgi:preprotein translocase subunit SecE